MINEIYPRHTYVRERRATVDEALVRVGFGSRLQSSMGRSFEGVRFLEDAVEPLEQALMLREGDGPIEASFYGPSDGRCRVSTSQ